MRSPRGFSELLVAVLVAELLVGGMSHSNLTTILSWGVIVAVGAIILLSVFARNVDRLWQLGLAVGVFGHFYGSSLPAHQQTLWPWYSGAALALALLAAFWAELGAGLERMGSLAGDVLKATQGFAESVVGSAETPPAEPTAAPTT